MTRSERRADEWPRWLPLRENLEDLATSIEEGRSCVTRCYAVCRLRVQWTPPRQVSLNGPLRDARSLGLLQ